MDFRDNFPSRLSKLVHAYGDTITPWELNPEDFYKFGWSDEEFAALELLGQREDVIEKGSNIRIDLTSLAKRRPYIGSKPSISLSLGWNYKYPSVRFDDDKISDPVLRSKLLRYCAAHAWYSTLATRAAKYVDQLVGRAGSINTPGQLVRIWPEAASFMDGHRSNKVVMQKLRSAMPEGWDEDEIAGFREQEYFDKINDVLLACTVMDVKAQDDTPTLFT